MQNNLSFEEYRSLKDQISKKIFFFDYKRANIVNRKSDGKEFVIVDYFAESKEDCLYYLLDYQKIQARKEKNLPPIRALMLTRKALLEQFNSPKRRLTVFELQIEGRDWVR